MLAELPTTRDEDWRYADPAALAALSLNALDVWKTIQLAAGEVRLPPTNTRDVIASGCLLAQVGAIEHYYRVMEGTACGAVALVSGGDADIIAGHLAIPARTVDNLVLRGLAVVAASSPCTNSPIVIQEPAP